MKKNVFEKISNILMNVLIVVFFVILFISIYSNFQIKILKNDYANFFGYSMFEVQTGSMNDVIKVGDWIVVKLTKDVETNDIITFKQNNNYITHRVIEMYQGTYVTKGDANNVKDDPIDQNQIVGKVVKVFGGFGILRKTIFNPIVIVALIITLFLFNLTFGNKKDYEKLKKLISTIVGYFNKSSANKNYKQEKNKHKIKRTNSNNNDNTNIDDELEDELSKTSMFRVISVNDLDVKETFNEAANNAFNDIEDELSKTSMFRIISADTTDIDKKVQKIVEKEKKENDVTNIYKVKVDAEKVVINKENDMAKNKKSESIDLDELTTKCNNEKTNNIIEKAFKIKKIEFNQIIDLLLKDEKMYIMKSNLRDVFINRYIIAKYYSGDDSTSLQKIKSSINELSEELIKKNIKDEKQQNIINSYKNIMYLIASFEQNRNAVNKQDNYIEQLKKYNNSSYDYAEFIAYNVIEIQKKCMEIMSSSLKKLETKLFTIAHSTISTKKNLSAIKLEHNISFSKVYSDYIVDKTYNEGIVAEDKIAVLLTLLSAELANDITKFNYNKKYIFAIPTHLYEKEKKLESLLKMINDEYAKNHIYICIDIDTLLKHKKEISKLKKAGYYFVLGLNKKMEFDDNNLGYLYLCDYIFISKDDVADFIEIVPNDLLDKVIKDNILEKVGAFGGE